MSFQKVVNLWSQLPACTGKYHLMHAKEMRLTRSGKKKGEIAGVGEYVCVCFSAPLPKSCSHRCTSLAAFM